jgi:hypothetical protein
MPSIRLRAGSQIRDLRVGGFGVGDGEDTIFIHLLPNLIGFRFSFVDLV